MSVSEGTGGVRRREADTELKTKTPHVNVGKKIAILKYPSQPFRTKWTLDGKN